MHALTSLAGSLPALTAAMLIWAVGYYKSLRRDRNLKKAIEHLHVEVNGRLTELMASIRKEAYGGGFAAGKQAEQDKQEGK